MCRRCDAYADVMITKYAAAEDVNDAGQTFSDIDYFWCRVCRRWCKYRWYWHFRSAKDDEIRGQRLRDGRRGLQHFEYELMMLMIIFSSFSSITLSFSDWCAFRRGRRMSHFFFRRFSWGRKIFISSRHFISSSSADGPMPMPMFSRRNIDGTFRLRWLRSRYWLMRPKYFSADLWALSIIFTKMIDVMSWKHLRRWLLIVDAADWLFLLFSITPPSWWASLGASSDVSFRWREMGKFLYFAEDGR